jgi:hypothetical protein
MENWTQEATSKPHHGQIQIDALIWVCLKIEDILEISRNDIIYKMGNILIKSGINWGAVPNSVFDPGEKGLNLAKLVEHHRTNWRIFKLTIHRSPIFFHGHSDGLSCIAETAESRGNSVWLKPLVAGM